MVDLHEVLFEWPHHEPNEVIVTGTFDQWSSSIHLAKGLWGFHGLTKVPWGEKIAYKFIVDGQWIVHENRPTEPDYDGNINNIYTAPPKPLPPILEVPPAVLPEPPQVGEPLNGTTDSPIAAAAPEKGTEESELVPTPVGVAEQVGDIPIMDSVASVDPVDPQIGAPALTPKDEATGEENPLTSVPEIAPWVVNPITIVPVNAPENNSMVAESHPETPQQDATSASISAPASPTATELEALSSSRDPEGRHTHVIIPPSSAAPAVDGTKPTSDATLTSETTSTGVIPTPIVPDPETGAASEVTEPTTLTVGETVPDSTPAADVVPIAGLTSVPSVPVEDATAAPTGLISTHLPETSSADTFETKEGEPRMPPAEEVQSSDTPIKEQSPTTAPAEEEQATQGTTVVPTMAIPLPDVTPSTDKPESIASAPAPVDKATNQQNGRAPTAEDKHHSNGNGHVTPHGSTGLLNSPPSTPTPSAPSTPLKKKRPFPSLSDSRSSSPNTSPLSSKTSTAASRKKKTSIFGKLKHIFGHDKDKDKK